VVADLHVHFRDADWLAVEKPSGIPTTAPDSALVESLVDRVRKQLAPDTKHLHPLSRLDVEVTGVVLFALTPRAIQAATRTREIGRYRRRYLSLLSLPPSPLLGTWEWPIGVDRSNPKLRTTRTMGKDIQSARTRYTTLGVAGIAWVGMELETGRTHQIRVHAARAGCPVVGDRSYGGPRHWVQSDGTVTTARRVMLHAHRVWIPERNESIESTVPEDFASIWAQCGGGPTELWPL
jgi:23S rRNA pseudouridine1911/1915/1917 synthase